MVTLFPGWWLVPIPFDLKLVGTVIQHAMCEEVSDQLLAAVSSLGCDILCRCFWYVGIFLDCVFRSAF